MCSKIIVTFTVFVVWMMMHTCQPWVLDPTLRNGLKTMKFMMRIMNMRIWMRMVRVWWRHRKEGRATIAQKKMFCYATRGIGRASCRERVLRLV